MTTLIEQIKDELAQRLTEEEKLELQEWINELINNKSEIITFTENFYPEMESYLQTPSDFRKPIHFGTIKDVKSNYKGRYPTIYRKVHEKKEDIHFYGTDYYKGCYFLVYFEINSIKIFIGYEY